MKLNSCIHPILYGLLLTVSPSTLFAAETTNMTMEAASFAVKKTGYYLDKGKWLAINPEKNKSAQATQAFPFPSGRYDVTLHAVGEEDGSSNYSVSINDQVIGEFICPSSMKAMEEGAAYNKTWKNQPVDSGDIIAIRSTIASADGKEYSRARWARITFTPADDTTQAAAMKPMRAPSDTSSATAAPLVLPRKADGMGSVVLSGELKEWHKATLTLDGPYAHELDNRPNPFLDYRFQVTFTHESGSPRYTVPGYFAADGDAANSSAESGTKWRAHLSPDKAGRWDWQISFLSGPHVAIGPAIEKSAAPIAPFDGLSGRFTVGKSDKTGRDFRGKGRLQYVGKHHLQFAGSKEYFLKAGPDSPETMLAYTDFDNTITGKPDKGPLKTWAPHVGDWTTGDPTWKNGKGKGLIGALNYLASKGISSFSFLSYNAGGDGDNIWPFVFRDDKLHWDCSKLDQWGIVFDHATARGLYLHFKLQENEMDDNRPGTKSTETTIPESLDGGKLGTERKLYCREIIARFGHELALNWNIGEENTQSTEEINAMIDYLRATDPYSHHIVIHTFPSWQDKVYTPLLGTSQLSGASLQNPWNQTHQRTLKWVTESEKAGRPWVVANDEQNGADTGVPPDLGYSGYNGTKKDGKTVQTPDEIRQATLWGNLMAGGAGVEYYFGYQLAQNDLLAEDFRSRDKSWDYCRIALDFFRDNPIPFWEMKNADALIGNAENDNSKYGLAVPGEVYLVYLPKGGTTELDLTGTKGRFTVQWFNPRQGGALQNGSVKTVSGGTKVALGTAPADAGEDWLVVVRR